jgi:pyruvate,water dikinase
MRDNTANDLQIWVKKFSELTRKEDIYVAGGKGSTLARLFQAGYPVPNGLIILPQAFVDDNLRPEVWAYVSAWLQKIRRDSPTVGFAVRSSALAEDSAQASFAGGFETILDVHTDEMIHASINNVRVSRRLARVQAYSQAKGISEFHDMAVIVQKLVRADISGVLFTADPVTGSFGQMVGNFVFGFGEELVSGEAEPFTFVFSRPKGEYQGPPELKRFSRRLYKLCKRLEDEFGHPQDIEWAIKGGRLYILQTRPITTMRSHDLLTGECNDSLRGDYLWSNCNFTEAIPNVMTPLTWSMWKIFYDETLFFKSTHPATGNICGRPYANVSFAVSMLSILGKNPQEVLKEFEGTFGIIPEDIQIPVIPISKRSMILTFIPNILSRRRKVRQVIAQMPEYISATAKWCSDMRARFNQANDVAELAILWEQDVFPYILKTFWMLRVSGKLSIDMSTKVQHELKDLVGENNANALLLHMDRTVRLSQDTDFLASLGPLVSIAKVAQDEMSRVEYFELYGHRAEEECELAMPRPYEDPQWLDLLLTRYKSTKVDLDEMVKKRRSDYDIAWKHFTERYPKKIRKMRIKLEKVIDYAFMREAVRSEVARVVGVIRSFALRTGEIAGIQEGIFFLYLEELLALLDGDASALEYITTRRSTYEKYRRYPPFPGIIRGRFDPELWLKDPNRRSDVFDAQTPMPVSKSIVLKGFAGSAGRVQGVVRVLRSMEYSDKFQEGEILVANTTNVGWTPLFPSAAAVVTDVGAPLSHAAIVARELGIPAVVGCGNATMLLETGDEVIVDGSKGIVEIL